MKHQSWSWFLGACAAIFLFGPSLVSASTMPAQMAGYAWAPNFGWINFGSSSSATAKVTVDQSTGIFSGYAWSPNIGWLRFGSTLTGPSTVAASEQGPVKATASTTKTGVYDIKGWFRACDIFASGCTGTEKSVTGTEMGGWDGWFKVKNMTYDSTTGKYSGYAWGDLVGGWVNLDTLSGSSTPTFSVSCTAYPGSPSVNDTVTWRAFTANGTGPFAYYWTEKKSTDSSATSFYGTGTSTATYSTVGMTVTRTILIMDQGTWTTASSTCYVTTNSDGSSDGGGGGTSVVISSPVCKVAVSCQGANQGTDNVIVDSVTSACGTTQTVTCGANTTLKTTKKVYWSDSACVSGTVLTGASSTSYTMTMPSSATTKNVCADWGGTAADNVTLNISGGLGTSGNLVRVNRPSTYPVNSTPTATLKLTGDSGVSIPITFDVSSIYDSLDETDSSVGSCNNPVLYIGSNQETINSGSLTKNLTVGSYNLYFKFPTKCPNSSGVSVFHKPSGYRTITISASNGASTKLLLQYNDPTPVNTGD